MLNLGLESLQVKEEVPTSLADLLQSELEFNKIYQDFVNYTNICEIVIKAKSKKENIEFASELLNVSIENINVSVEALSDKFKNAWRTFIELWNKFVKWFKRIVSRNKKEETKFSDFPVEVSPPLDRIIHFPKMIFDIRYYLGGASGCHHFNDIEQYENNEWFATREINNLRNDINKTGKIFSTEEAYKWIKYAEGSVNQLNEIMPKVKLEYKDRKQKGYVKKDDDIRTPLELEGALPDNKATIKNALIGTRYLMFISKKLISSLRSTIVRLYKLDLNDNKTV